MTNGGLHTRGEAWLLRTDQGCTHLKIRHVFYYGPHCAYTWLAYHKWPIAIYKHICGKEMYEWLVLVECCGVVCYISTHLSTSTLIGILEPLDSLLETDYMLIMCNILTNINLFWLGWLSTRTVHTNNYVRLCRGPHFKLQRTPCLFQC